jgi:hypothetical protein
MHPDIAKAVELIDQRIATLQNIRRELVREFVGGERIPSVRTKSLPNTSRNGHGTRKEQVAEFISSHGPATRSEIISGTDIPTGTIAYCLNDEKRFVNQDGKWHLRKE